jgi:hypothetical protein
MAPAGCTLSSAEGMAGQTLRVGAAGRFMLDCGGESPTAVLDVRSGVETELGHATIIWQALGSHYVQGYTPEDVCPATPAERSLITRGCVALFDLATGAVTYRPPLQVVDLERVGAPPACRPLQVAAHLTPSLTAYFTVDDSLAYGAQDGNAIVLLHCQHSQKIRAHEASNYSLGGGVLTWDDALDAREPEGFTTHQKTLTAVEPATERRRAWHVPDVRVQGELEPLPPQPYGWVAHAGRDVFWISPRKVKTSGPTGLSVSVIESAVYEARI